MDRGIDTALTREELDDLKPPVEEMFQNSQRSTKWYNEAVMTAASLMVEAAEQSDEFREAFVNETTQPVSMGDDMEVEMQVWREIIDEECPDVAERLWGIGLSASQGGMAESVARNELEE